MNDDVKDEGTGSQVPEEVIEVEPGTKTDPALLLKALQDEREEKRRERELRIAAEEALIAKQALDVDLDTPEGDQALTRVKALEDQIALRDISEKLPVLKDNLKEFNDFRKEYPGVSLESAAKLFINEKGLGEKTVERPGLEKTSGGGRVTPQVGMSEEDVSNLRNTNFRKYSQLVREGKIKI